MTRELLVRQLQAHAATTADAHEAEMASLTWRFIEEQPCCAERTLQIGHLTGSAWIVDQERRKTLLTHHRKLEKWLQLGGHADGDLDICRVAMREAEEESGLTRLRFVSEEIFDVDRHWIPARKDEPAHWHYDLRYMIEADAEEKFVVSAESKELAWVEIERMADFSTEASMLRMAAKTLALR